MRPGGLPLTDRAMKLCKCAPGARVADIGCGSCDTVTHLLNVYGIHAFGLDPSEIHITHGLREMPRLFVARGLAEALPFGGNSLDGLLCECALSLVPDIDTALSEFSRVLKPGGFLIIHDVFLAQPAYVTEPVPLRETYGLPGACTREEMEQLLKGHRFSVEVWEDHTQALKEFAVQSILTHGSLDGFWSGACGDLRVKEAGRPGYYLLIARRPVS
jgi:ubiquinone/menaquinone biosynthesis C-methylase UbiE